jgi:hypothetical protein
LPSIVSTRRARGCSERYASIARSTSSPVGVVDDHERAGDEVRLGDAEAFELGLEGVVGVVVPDADTRIPEHAAGTSSNGIADDDLRHLEAVPGEIRLDLLQARRRESRSCDADEALAFFAEHRETRLAPWLHADSRHTASPSSRQLAARLISARLFSRARFSTSSATPGKRRSRGCSGARIVLEQPGELLEEAISFH